MPVDRLVRSLSGATGRDRWNYGGSADPGTRPAHRSFHSAEPFYRLREIKGIEKKPATRELINWVRALRMDADFKVKDLIKGQVPYLGVLFKKSPDYVVAQNSIARFKI